MAYESDVTRNHSLAEAERTSCIAARFGAEREVGRPRRPPAGKDWQWAVGFGWFAQKTMLTATCGVMNASLLRPVALNCTPPITPILSLTLYSIAGARLT